MCLVDGTAPFTEMPLSTIIFIIYHSQLHLRAFAAAATHDDDDDDDGNQVLWHSRKFFGSALNELEIYCI